MIVALVAAIAENRVIGRDGRLPWRIPGELAHFKRTTMGKPIIMGRKTWQSLGRPLPGRANIVITRDPGFKAGGADVVNNLERAVAVAGRRADDLGGDEIMVIGGGEIYRLAFPKADRMYLTHVHVNAAGDARFPQFDPAQWLRTEGRSFPAEGNSPAYTLAVYDREKKSRLT